MLNYAYAVLESQVRMQIVAAGYDPTVGYLHTSTPERQALVLDLMAPQRPIVDWKVLQFAQAHTFHPADFTIRSDGVCRLNPEMAKHIVHATMPRQPVVWNSPKERRRHSFVMLSSPAKALHFL